MRATARTLAFATVVGLAMLALLPQGADATIGGTLVSCPVPAGDVGDAKVSPGFSTVERRNTIVASLTPALSCIANEAQLDEIAAESKFGVTKTAAGGRTAIVSALVKAKFTFYSDCLGLLITFDPDTTGEYPVTYGKLKVSWLDAGGVKVASSQAFGVLDIVLGTFVGRVTRGLGLGGTFTFSGGFPPSPLDDHNGNALEDFLECAFFADPTAVGIYFDIVGPGSLSIDVP